MLDFLSTDWLDALDKAAAPTERPYWPTTQEARLVIQQVITDRPGGDMAYYIRLDHGDIGVRAGRGDRPHVELHH